MKKINKKNTVQFVLQCMIALSGCTFAVMSVLALPHPYNYLFGGVGIFATLIFSEMIRKDIKGE